MRGVIGSSALIGIAVATVLAASGCNDDSKSESAPATTPAAASSKERPPTPLPGDPVQCGPGALGLAVIAYTTKGNALCQTAVAVTDAYHNERARQPDGDIAVTVENVRWICGVRQGDPNPYQECASQNESADIVRLVS